ncbi:MAG TPA: alpha-glucan family phosphorylase [Actinomycetes bacterium]|nr:alpha-glucan family phosphorylase [Actinomycetes bacterium]
MRAIRRFTVRTVLPEPLAPLGELVSNLRWSWHAPTRDLLASIDPELWHRLGEDPTRLLGAVPPSRLESLAHDGDFLGRLHAAHDHLQHYLAEPRWYQSYSEERPASVAYFSPEFGITHVLPQYSGGLGILAGDHLKSASDLGVPILGVGLLYRSGYFKQSLSADGWQQEYYPVLDPNELPITLVRDASGQPLTVRLDLPSNRALVAQVWKAEVGRVPLLLLDSNTERNEPQERDVTDRLYGGGSEHRLLQEMLLGIGGVRALRAWCRLTDHPMPEVWHTNEGHAGFQGVERIRELVEDEGLGFEAAIEAARAGTVFTTHTPVPAGIDRFPRELVEQHFNSGVFSAEIPVERILSLGAETYQGGDPSVFNMAVMGLRLAQRSNGVARLHGVVSRRMFNGLWPAFDEDEVPIQSVTNGVHAPTWVAREALHLIERATGGQDVSQEGDAWAALEHVSDGEIWATRRLLRERLVQEARQRLRASWLQRGASPAELSWIDDVLDPDVLTIGFARRVPSYKRLTLMMHDEERLKSLLLHPTRPVQIVVAGKAHPADDGGKKLIQQLVRFSDDPEIRHRIVFLPDYDMAMAQNLYPGCDVWLNNPLRPLEACGTSGMKAALNGCLNLSILDGWWDEMFDGQNGWAIPTADGVDDPERRDALEAGALYELIENGVSTRFYDRDEHGNPPRWLAMVRHTLATLGPKVLASRMVRDYVTELYTPAAVSARAVDGPGHARAVGLAAWKARVTQAWPAVRVDHVETTPVEDAPELGQKLGLRVFVSVGSLTPDDVRVEVVHGRVDDNDRIIVPSESALEPAEEYEDGRWRYEGTLTLERAGSFGYTIRVLPRNELLASPAEMNLVALPPDRRTASETALR